MRAKFYDSINKCVLFNLLFGLATVMDIFVISEIRFEI